MRTFEQAGEAMLLAEQGQREIANAVLTSVKRWIAGFQAWRGRMPTAMPPTESHPR